MFACNNNIGPLTPDQVLPEGVDSTNSVNPYTGESAPARKGTVAATLNNIAYLNTMLLTDREEGFIQQTKEAIVELLPSLRAIGVFDLFTIEEWLTTKDQQGRIFAAVLYLQKYPEKKTQIILEKLLQIREAVSSELLRKEINLLIG
jgi:hypothetical protein